MPKDVAINRRGPNSVDVPPYLLKWVRRFEKKAKTRTSAGLELGLSREQLGHIIDEGRTSPAALEKVISFYNDAQNSKSNGGTVA